MTVAGEDQNWVRGPNPRSRNPIASTYIQGTLDRDCPNCLAPHGEYCVYKGTDVRRRMPVPAEVAPHRRWR